MPMILQRDLHPFPVAEAMKALLGGVPQACVMTMGIQQWDGLLSAAYIAGFILLELDENEKPVRAFKKVSE